jgi:branched-chain amino acid transport system permease protein
VIDELVRAERRHSISSLALLAIVLVLVALIGATAGPVIRTTVVTFFIYLVLVVGLQCFVGNSGVFSFGHVAFMAIGAYTVGILRIPAQTKSVLFQSLPQVQLPPVVAMLIGAFAAALVAIVIAYPLMRLTGLVAGLATFALLNIVYIVARNLNDITGGSTGLANVPVSTTPWTAGLWSIVAVALVWLFARTTTALRLRATREDEAAARATGVGVTRERMAAFVVSAFVAGLAGGLFAQFFGSFNPEAFFLKTTFLAVAMLVVGGALSLSGAVFGALFISTVTELLRRAEKGFSVAGIDVPSRPGLQELGVAVAMLLALLLRPNGLTGGREIALPSLSRRRNAAPVAPASDPAAQPSEVQI